MISGINRLMIGFGLAVACCVLQCEWAECAPAVTDGQPTLAIINKHKNPALADLLFESLSKSRTVDLVERQELSKVLAEMELSSTARERNIKLGHLVNADALLFIEPDAELLHIVLVETAQGERFFDAVSELTDGTYSSTANRVEQLLMRAVPKLRLDVHKRRYLGLLSFERKGNVPVWVSLRAIRSLLATHLTSIPSVIMVERENLDSVIREIEMAGDDQAGLSIADYIIRGMCESQGKDQLAVTVQLKSVKSGERQTAEFQIAEATLSESIARISGWVCRELVGEAVAKKSDLETEAALHFRNAEVFEANGLTRWAHESFETAYLLRPREKKYAERFISVLHARMNARNCPYESRLGCFCRAMDISRAIDPEKKAAPVQIPRFLYGVPGGTGEKEQERLSDSRRRVETYYRWYCDYESGLPDKAHRNVWAGVSPLFFDTPQEALAHLKSIIELGEFNWGGLVGHCFTSIRYWDEKKARQMWLGFLEELSSHDSLVAQLHAHRALYNYFGTVSNVNYHRQKGEAARKASEKFFSWLCSDKVYPLYVSGQLSVSAWEFWSTFGCLNVPDRDMHWNRAVIPRLRRLEPRGGDKIAELGSFAGFLKSGCNKDRPGEKEKIEHRVQEAQKIVNEVFAEGNQEHRSRYRWDRRAERLFNGILTHIGTLETDPPTPRDLSRPDIPGTVVLFDYFEDVPKSIWNFYNTIRPSPIIVSGYRSWIAFAVQRNGLNGEGLITLATLNAKGKQKDIQSVKAPAVGYGFFRTPVQLAKTTDFLCVAELGNVLAVPLRKDGTLNMEGHVFLSKEHGLPPLGGRAHKVTCLSTDGEHFYIAVDYPKRLLRSRIYGTAYGALFRWKPGMKQVEEVCAAASLKPGALNDCKPYSIFEAEASEDSKSIFFFIKWGPREGWWRYIPSRDKWSYIGKYEPRHIKTPNWEVKHINGRPIVYYSSGEPE